jgi:hypothetical protein
LAALYGVCPGLGGVPKKQAILIFKGVEELIFFKISALSIGLKNR